MFDWTFSYTKIYFDFRQLVFDWSHLRKYITFLFLFRFCSNFHWHFSASIKTNLLSRVDFPFKHLSTWPFEFEWQLYKLIEKISAGGWHQAHAPSSLHSLGCGRDMFVQLVGGQGLNVNVSGVVKSTHSIRWNETDRAVTNDECICQ